MMLLLLQAGQGEGARTADVNNPMGAHTWFIIIAVGAFLLWCISYSLQLRKEALARKKGREDVVRRKDELIDRIVDLEAQKDAGTIAEKKYKQELKDLKFQLTKVLGKVNPLPPGEGGRPKGEPDRAKPQGRPGEGRNAHT